MTNDTRVKAAVLTLHRRFVESPTEKGAMHILKFIAGSFLDVTPPCHSKLRRYFITLENAEVEQFSPKSIAHLDTVAKETLI